MDLKFIMLVALFVFAVQSRTINDEIQEDAPSILSDFEDSSLETKENLMEFNDELNDPKGIRNASLEVYLNCTRFRGLKIIILHFLNYYFVTYFFCS